MSVALVQQQKANASSGTSVTATFGAGTTAGNFVAALLVHAASFMNAPSVTGPTGYTQMGLQFFNANQVSVDVFYKQNIGGGVTGITASGGNNISKTLFIFEFSGIPTTGGLLDASGGAGATSSAPSASTTTTLSGPDLLIMATGAVQNAAITAGTSDGSQEYHDVNGAMLAEYKLLGTNGQIATLSATLGSSLKWEAAIGAFVKAPDHLQTIPVVEGSSSSLAFLKGMSIRVAKAATISALKNISKKFVFTKSSAASLLRLFPKKLFVNNVTKFTFFILQYRTLLFTSGSAVTTIRTRLRQILVTAHPTLALVHLRAHFMAVSSATVANMLVMVPKTIFVAAASLATVGPAYLKRILVAANSTVKVVRTRLRTIAIHAASGLSLIAARNILLFVAEANSLVLNAYKVWVVLIDPAVLTFVTVARGFVKHLVMTSGHSITIKVPRLLKRTITVAGSNILNFIRRRPDPTLSHGTKFDITASQQTNLNIDRED